MATRRLPNYLRKYRKRTSLSQEEVAFLSGCQAGVKFSRYERFLRQPTLENALACEIAFGVPVRLLFAGTYQKVERLVLTRARLLAQKLAAAGMTEVTARKLEALQAAGTRQNQ